MPTPAEPTVAERFRLSDHRFLWEAKRLPTVTASFEIWDVTFPSPVKTTCETNNTVWCEYYQSNRPAKMPGVIVLHILGGDFELSRMFCKQLALSQVCALFVKLPYYGEREQPGAVPESEREVARVGDRDRIDPAMQQAEHRAEARRILVGRQ